MTDLISREDAEMCLTADITNMSIEEYISMVGDRLKKLPSIQPKAKTGHWKRISIDKYSQHAMYWYRCDRCGEDNLGNTDWCPNCGVKMEEK